MTGSGATIFGVCSDIEAAEGAVKWLTARHPDWWVQATRIQDLDHASRLVGAA
jgi:4-diphosphocytidyl-2-C-methyl-D-erythritol kinase